MNKVLLGMILSVVIVSSIIGISAAPSDKAKDAIATHVTNDNAYRVLQVFDIKSVEKGSQITQANAVFTLADHIGDDCVLILNESHLNKDEISEHFVCAMSNVIPLEIKGVHALQTKLNSEKFAIEIQSENGLVDISSSDIELDISYTSPTYYAQIENGIVTSVIVADQNFVDSLAGQWVLSDNLAGVGYSYDGIIFTAPQPYPSWNLINNVWTSPIISPGSNYTWDEGTLSWVKFNG
jgi:hypothetical protein